MFSPMRRLCSSCFSAAICGLAVTAVAPSAIPAELVPSVDTNWRLLDFIFSAPKWPVCYGMPAATARESCIFRGQSIEFFDIYSAEDENDVRRMGDPAGRCSFGRLHAGCRKASSFPIDHQLRNRAAGGTIRN